ncbi:hypothetical protein C4559_03745, partial [Candidatus Microgenomates bacterium]
GGWYGGGGGGYGEPNDMAGGGGGSGYIGGAGVSNGTTIAAYNSIQANSTDLSNGGAGAAGAASINGQPGKVIIIPDQTATGTIEEDSSPYYNNGVLAGTSIVNGIRGKARSFNGSSDRIDAGSSIASPFITVEAWVYRTSATTNMGIVRKNNTYALSLVSNTIQIAPGNNWTFYNTGVGIEMNQWIHLAMTYNGNTLSVYKNGILIASWALDGVFPTTNTTRTYIGYDDNNWWWGGYIDEVRISNIARPIDDISESYRMGRDQYINRTISSTDLSGKQSLPFYVAADKPGNYLTTTIGESAFANYQPDTNTVGLWHLDELSGTGSYLKDSSANRNNATPPGSGNVQGKIGRARNFNGSSEYISVADNSTLTLGSNFSIDTWVNMSVLKDSIFVGHDNGGGNVNKWFFAYDFNAGIGGTANTLAFHINSAATPLWITTPWFPVINKWYHLAVTRSGGNTYTFFVNGIAIGTSINATSIPDPTANLTIGQAESIGYTNGKIDEVRISNVARTSDEIRQAYEYGVRNHPITIDFAAKLDSGNLITNSGDLGFTVDATIYGLQQKGDKLYNGDKIIVKENYNGTEYIAQGVVTSVTPSTGAVTVLSWDSGSTFPTGGYTINAAVFKWQREYWNVTEPLDSQLNMVTNLTLHVTDGNENRTVWLDDFKSAGDYLTTPGGSTILSSTGNRYFQYRLINHSFDEAVSASITNVTLDYTTPVATLDAPTNGAADQFLSPLLRTTMTNGNAVYLQYKIELCTNLAMTLNCQTFDQTSDQTGWSGMNTQGNTAYTSGTQAIYTIQTPLNAATSYYWRSYAIDPGGNNVWSSTQGTPFSFVTTATPTAPASPYAEGASNPARIFDLNPEFSAIHNDSDGDAANYYEIEVNTNSGFTGTVMWDTGAVSMSNLANGQRSADFSYAGTALSFNSATYYWRIRFTDVNGATSPWSVTQNFTMDHLPNTPSLDYPVSGTIDVPVRAVLKTTTTDNNGDYLKYKIRICTDSLLTIGCQTFDQTNSQTGWSGQNTQSNTAYTSGTQATYTIQSALSVGTDYYWKSYAIDPGASNTWSSTQTTPHVFSTTPIVVPSAPTTMLTNGGSNPTGVLTSTTPYFSAIHNDIDNQSASHYQIIVSSQPDVNGAIFWDSGQTVMSTTANGTRTSNITYAGIPLSLNGQILYWKVRFWDTGGNVGTWSAPASFTLFNLAPPSSCMAVKDNTNTQITIRWLDQTSSEDGYYIEKKTDGGGFTNLTTKAASSTTHVDTSVPSGHSYQYRVRSKMGSDYSDWCTTATLNFTGNFMLNGLKLNGLQLY